MHTSNLFESEICHQFGFWRSAGLWKTWGHNNLISCPNCSFGQHRHPSVGAFYQTCPSRLMTPNTWPIDSLWLGLWDLDTIFFGFNRIVQRDQKCKCGQLSWRIFSIFSFFVFVWASIAFPDVSGQQVVLIDQRQTAEAPLSITVVTCFVLA